MAETKRKQFDSGFINLETDFKSPFELFKELFPEFKDSGQTLGSGVIIDRDGYILTNNHVIDQASSIKVILFDKTEIEAECCLLTGKDEAQLAAQSDKRKKL